MMEWEKKWPELEGLSDLERYHLFRAAKKRLFSKLNGYVSVLSYGLVAVGLAVAIHQGARFLLGASFWVNGLSFLIGLFLAIYSFDCLYSNRLRRVVRVILEERWREAKSLLRSS
ncbi:MAG: hypothetical protein EA419_02225 [Wenzhouxiangella sp.]|nr:MAG: hypothetical protein EA419_02225 [Wenzhouxiangella sp.]